MIMQRNQPRFSRVDINPLYFETHFLTEEHVVDWPKEFAIVTAFATTGEKWTAEKNARQDASLKAYIDEMGVWHRRITGYNPDSGHAEPGWAVQLDLRKSCRLGEEFLQDAIYYVSDGLLAVSECKDGRCQLIPVGSFTERVTVKGK